MQLIWSQPLLPQHKKKAALSRKKLVVLTGAGISAESGLKTFRDSDGLWEGYDIEEVATYHAWQRNPVLVLDFYNARRRDVVAAQPNAAHKALAELESHFEVTIITQNIDDLHERAGSGSVLHLHGEILKKRSDADPPVMEGVLTDMLPGERAADGALWRPHVVWFGEPVPMIEKAARLVQQADILAVIGTSLAVYPAAGLVNVAPENIPLFIVDKKIPAIADRPNLTIIESAAGIGVPEMARIMLSML